MFGSHGAYPYGLNNSVYIGAGAKADADKVALPSAQEIRRVGLGRASGPDNDSNRYRRVCAPNR